MPFGFIYRISSPNYDKVYIGSTINKYLSERKAKHIYDYKGYLKGTRHYRTSFEILKYENCIYDTLEKFEYTDVRELRQREGELIKESINCLNKYPQGLNIV